MTTTSMLRKFRIHAGHVDRHHAILVEETSFETAVIAFVEDHPAAAETGDEMRVIVHDVASGHEHCFMVDLATGETSSCG
jgi:hypothetical protein